MYGTVSVDRTVGNDTFFVVTWTRSISPPRIYLTDPKGKNYTKTDFAIDNTNLRTARLKIPGTAEVKTELSLQSFIFNPADNMNVPHSLKNRQLAVLWRKRKCSYA